LFLIEKKGDIKEAKVNFIEALKYAPNDQGIRKEVIIIIIIIII
jgi:hypothetical protein